jgi:hemolysin III
LSNFKKGIEQYPYQINFMQTKIQYIQIRQELVNSITWFWNYFWYCKYSILIAFAIKSDNTSGIIGAAIYCFCFLQLLLFYTLRNQHAQAKRTLEILDHISIYFLMRYLHPFYLCICLILLV